MPVGMLSIVVITLHACLTVVLANSDSKRLLLNDPDVLADRLNRLESVVHILNDTVKQLTTENQQQKQFIHKLSSQQNTGSTYIRWGKTKCPNIKNTELVYSGFAGGGLYTETGSGSQYVCLSPDPKFNKTTGPDTGRMYGAEFKFNFWAPNSDNEDVPCALCRTSRSTTVMIPGTYLCDNGWTREFYGYLASGRYTHAASSSFACVDINPEYLNSGAAAMNGKLFYNVLAKCGSLPCPPYINNYPLTCVVCSK